MAPKKKKEKKEGEGNTRGDARAAIFALFEKRGVEASDVPDEVVIAEAKKHGREPSHNAVVKYRSLFRLERGIAPARAAKPAKPKPAKPKPAKEAKPKAAKPAKPKSAKPKAAKSAKKPAKQRARSDGGASSVDQLARVLDIEPIGSTQ